MENALDQSMTLHKVLPEQWQTLKTVSTHVGVDNEMRLDLLISKNPSKYRKICMIK